MGAPRQTFEDTFNAFIDDHRSSCLWFLRADYYPVTRAQRLRALDYIQRYGDRETYRQAAALRQWLLQHSSERSAAC